MRVQTPKAREWSRELLERAIEFHGHGGPFMVIGLRMGLTALKRLDAEGWFDLRCRVSLRWRPPDSCVIDGIQSSTGCTTGKHNIEVEEREGISAHFLKDDKGLRIALKKNVEERIRTIMAEKPEETSKIMTELIEGRDHEIFDTTQIDPEST